MSARIVTSSHFWKHVCMWGLLVSMCMRIRVHVRLHFCVCACGDQRSTSDALLCHFPRYLRQSFLNLKFVFWLDCLRKQGPGIGPCLPPESHICAITSNFARELNTGPQAFRDGHFIHQVTCQYCFFILLL